MKLQKQRLKTPKTYLKFDKVIFFSNMKYVPLLPERGGGPLMVWLGVGVRQSVTSPFSFEKSLLFEFYAGEKAPRKISTDFMPSGFGRGSVSRNSVFRAFLPRCSSYVLFGPSPNERPYPKAKYRISNPNTQS
mgnify:CR=1 FL=1